MDQIMETMATMVIMVITATMGTMETMEITTIMVIILTSMLHQKLQSLVEMVPMEMVMDLTITEMETDPMDCAARSHAKSVNQSGSQSVRIIPLPAAKKSQPKYPPQSQLKSANRSPPKYAEM